MKNLKELIEKYEYCKVCNSKNIISFGMNKRYAYTPASVAVDIRPDYKRKKEIVSKAENIATLFNYCDTGKTVFLKNNEIIMIENGPFETFIAEGILNIKNNSYKLSAIDKYIRDIFILNMQIFCPQDENTYFTDYTGKDTSPSDYAGDYTSSPLFSHYRVQISLSVNQIENNYIFYLNNEHIITSDYIFTINFEKKTTNITKKIKELDIPFILDIKDINDFDFSKIELKKDLLE